MNVRVIVCMLVICSADARLYVRKEVKSARYLNAPLVSGAIQQLFTLRPFVTRNVTTRGLEEDSPEPQLLEFHRFCDEPLKLVSTRASVYCVNPDTRGFRDFRACLLEARSAKVKLAACMKIVERMKEKRRLGSGELLHLNSFLVQPSVQRLFPRFLDMAFSFTPTLAVNPRNLDSTLFADMLAYDSLVENDLLVAESMDGAGRDEEMIALAKQRALMASQANQERSLGAANSFGSRAMGSSGSRALLDKFSGASPLKLSEMGLGRSMGTAADATPVPGSAPDDDSDDLEKLVRDRRAADEPELPTYYLLQDTTEKLVGFVFASPTLQPLYDAYKVTQLAPYILKPGKTDQNVGITNVRQAPRISTCDLSKFENEECRRTERKLGFGTAVNLANLIYTVGSDIVSVVGGLV